MHLLWRIAPAWCEILRVLWSEECSSREKRARETCRSSRSRAMCCLRGIVADWREILRVLRFGGDDPRESNTAHRPVCRLRCGPETGGKVLRLLWCEGADTLTGRASPTG